MVWGAVWTPLGTGASIAQRAADVWSCDTRRAVPQGREAGVFDRSIDNQISRLRRKIEDDPKTPKHIKTVWGGGYSFATEVRKL